MKYLKYINDNLYHIYNRGVDGRTIFMEDKDYLRFIHSLYEFNDRAPALPYSLLLKRKEIFNKPKTTRQLLVHILCFCLMPNHYHLILRQTTDDGISKFMQKLGTGYTMYFNEKYKRSGVLFQGRFKTKAVEQDEYLIHLSRYIHLNPVGLIYPDWKERGLDDHQRVEKFLKGYRWSSFADYLSLKNFPSVTKRDFLQAYFSSPDKYGNFVFGFLAKDILVIRDFLLE